MKSLVLATFSLLTFAVPDDCYDDCYFGGPYLQDDNTLAVIDNGSSGNTKNTGCDGCEVTFDVEVLWWHTGDAIIADPGGGETVIQVTPWQVTSHTGTYSIACGGTKRWDFIHAGGGGAAWATCTACTQ